MKYPCTVFFSWSSFPFFSWKSRGCSDWCWETLFFSSTFYTHSLLLPITHTTNMIQKTLVAFKFSFYPFNGKGHFLACFLSRLEVHEVGRWFAVLPVKGVCLWWKMVFPVTHCSSQVFLSQDSVESCENTYNRLVPSGWDLHLPCKQIATVSLYLFILGGVTSAVGLEERLKTEREQWWMDSSHTQERVSYDILIAEASLFLTKEWNSETSCRYLL